MAELEIIERLPLHDARPLEEHFWRHKELAVTSALIGRHNPSQNHIVWHILMIAYHIIKVFCKVLPSLLLVLGNELFQLLDVHTTIAGRHSPISDNLRVSLLIMEGLRSTEPVPTVTYYQDIYDAFAQALRVRNS